ncbi:MAG: hypothetical protein AAF333_07745 [Planctomycetota bacterium]
MSDDIPPPNPSGPDGDRPRKRRRRRRNKNKGGASGQSPGNTSGDKSKAPGNADASAPSPKPQPARDKNKSGPRDNTKGDQPAAGSTRGKPRSERRRDGNQQSPARSSGSKRDGGPNRNDKRDNAAPPPQTKKKKRRKPRTKQCVNCFTPCTTIHRVRLDYRKQWVFICDICWPTRCVDNPHYEFGGTWVSGRIVKPESQQRDEWLAKQKQKKSPPAETQPSEPRTEAHESATDVSVAVAEPPASDHSAPAAAETPEVPQPPAAPEPLDGDQE